jgi:hypothetical protein
MTMSASAAEKKPAENRDILSPRNRALTIRAERSRGMDQRNLSRDTVDAYVQEGSNERSEEETKGGQKGLHL